MRKTPFNLGVLCLCQFESSGLRIFAQHKCLDLTCSKYIQQQQNALGEKQKASDSHEAKDGTRLLLSLEARTAGDLGVF